LFGRVCINYRLDNLNSSKTSYKVLSNYKPVSISNEHNLTINKVANQVDDDIFLMKTPFHS